MTGRFSRCQEVASTLETALPVARPPSFTDVPCLVSAGLFASIVGLVAALVSPLVSTGAAATAGAGIGIAVSLSAGYGTWTVPDALAAARRRSAAGAAPTLVAMATVQARLTPSLERAGRFASQHTGGLLGTSLARTLRNHPTGQQGWEAFADSWSAYDSSLQRSTSLMAAGIDSAQPARDALLDRALETVLAGSRERVARFATDTRGPATAIYAFGVLLPLAMVGLLPVAATAGAGIPPTAIAILYDGLIPAGLVVASGWLAVRRPAVTQLSVDIDHLDSPRSAWTTALLGLAAGVTSAAIARTILPGWATWVLVPGVALGVAIVHWFGPLRERRKRIEALESGVPDAVALAGHRLAAGDPLESAVEAVAADLSGETAAVFERGVQIHRRLRVTIEEAFSGDVGALSGVESPRTETALSLIAAGARNGSDGGRTLVTIATYLQDLQTLEREARRDIARTTKTLYNTALVFGPVIAGVTVALATGMGSLGDGGQTVPVGVLGVIIGVYVLTLAVVLPALTVALERGPDLQTMGYRIGVTLTTASLVYPTTFVAARSVVQV